MDGLSAPVRGRHGPAGRQSGAASARVMVALALVGMLPAAAADPPAAAPPPGTDAAREDAPGTVSRIALGSCARQDRPQPIWSAILRYDPDVMLLGGRDSRYRDESQLIFCDFFGLSADDPVRTQAGIYRSVVLGPPGRRVQFICLDTRSHRSPLEQIPPAERQPGQGPYRPSTDCDATVLGAAQWRWLARTLRETAELRVILSSIQVASIDHPWKHRGHVPDERARLLKTIRDSGANGVVIVGGDRRAAEISRIPPGAAALASPLYDLTASSLNQPQRVAPDHESNRHRLGRRFHGASFGTIGIEWDDAPATPPGQLTLAIRDELGAVVVERRVPLADLAPPVPGGSR